MTADLRAKKNLLLVLAGLLGVKFALFPLIEWQSTKFESFQASSRQLEKINHLISKQAAFQQEIDRLSIIVRANNSGIYDNSGDIKLQIQRGLEETFSSHNLDITGFNWVLDSGTDSEPLRVLRGTVYFSGPTEAMIRSFWEVAASIKLSRVVSWQQQIKRFGEDVLGGTRGNVTFEFYVSKNDVVSDGLQLGVSDE
tara:strand:+ start:2385 stop:2975 length:591 start_codon:yes stop_codon:yes gene_type:complete